MSTVRRVSPAEARGLMDAGYVYVDVRSEQEYAAGHPTNAVNVPLMFAAPGGMRPNADFLEVMSALYAKDAKLVLGCRSGQRSLRAAELLLGAGFIDVIEQRAGFDGARNAFGGVSEAGWSQAGLPSEATTPEGSYAELLARAKR